MLAKYAADTCRPCTSVSCQGPIIVRLTLWHLDGNCSLCSNFKAGAIFARTRQCVITLQDDGGFGSISTHLKGASAAVGQVDALQRDFHTAALNFDIVADRCLRVLLGNNQLVRLGKVPRVSIRSQCIGRICNGDGALAARNADRTDRRTPSEMPSAPAEIAPPSYPHHLLPFSQHSLIPHQSLFTDSSRADGTAAFLWARPGTNGGLPHMAQLAFPPYLTV